MPPANGLSLGTSKLRSDDSGRSRSKILPIAAPAPPTKAAPPARAAPPSAAALAPPSAIVSLTRSPTPSNGFWKSRLGSKLEDLSCNPSRGLERSGGLISGGVISGGSMSPTGSLARSNIFLPSAAAAAAPPAIAAPPARLMSLALSLTVSTTPLKFALGALRFKLGRGGKVPERSPDRRSPDRRSSAGRKPPMPEDKSPERSPDKPSPLAVRDGGGG